MDSFLHFIPCYVLMIFSGCKGTMFFSNRQNFSPFFFLLPAFCLAKLKKAKGQSKKNHFFFAGSEKILNFARE